MGVDPVFELIDILECRVISDRSFYCFDASASWVVPVIDIDASKWNFIGSLLEVLDADGAAIRAVFLNQFMRRFAVGRCIVESFEGLVRASDRFKVVFPSGGVF